MPTLCVSSGEESKGEAGTTVPIHALEQQETARCSEHGGAPHCCQTVHAPPKESRSSPAALQVHHVSAVHGQPPRAGTQQAAQCLGMATSKPASSTKDPKVLGHVESRSVGAREALSLGGQMKQCSAKRRGEGRANRAEPGASVDGAGIPGWRCPGDPWADC